MRIWTRSALIAACACAALSVAAQSMAETVGRTSAVRPNATQTPPGASPAALHVNDAVMRNAELDTTGSGALEVIFADNSKLSLGPNSNAVIDEFVYAGPGNSAGTQTLKYTKGVFRFVSGAVPPENVKVKTPAVTIGIRGTEFRVFVQGDGGTYIAAVQHNVFYVTNSGQIGVVPQGSSIFISATGEAGPVIEGTTLPCD
jgi:hypothetical protein